jgi:MFS family permease
MTLGVIALITLLAFEGIGTATAMPVIARDLDALGSYTWAFTGFVLASIMGMVGGGLWSDARGPRGPLIVGTGVFGLGAVVAGVAPGLPLLVGGRLLQGLGSGAVIVAVYVLISRAYPEEVRAKAFSVLAAAWVIPALVGPVIAGWLADQLTWRLVFLLVPVVVLLPAALLLPRLGSFQGGSPQTGVRRRLTAGVAATIALLAVQDGVLRLSPLGALEAVLGVVVLVVAARVLLPTGSLRLARGLPTSVMMRGLLAAAFFSAEVFVPLALVEMRGTSTTGAGLILASSSVAWSVGSYLQSRLPGQQDRSVAVATGAGIVALGLATLPIVLLTDLPPWIAVGSWALGALGMGLAVPSISVQVMRLSPPPQQGVNASAIQIVDAVGVVVAVSLLGVVHALAVQSGGATVGTYVSIWAVATVVAGSGILLASRMRPRASA